MAEKPTRGMLPGLKVRAYVPHASREIQYDVRIFGTQIWQFKARTTVEAIALLEAIIDEINALEKQPQPVKGDEASV